MQLPSLRRWLRRGGLIHRPCASRPRFAFGAALTESTPPAWWLKGRPRNVFQSRAEVELLSQLAVLLMPDEPIAEAFRDFPIQRCQEWGSSRLCPDFAAHGVLKTAGAALFIEYDGHYRHMEPQGLDRDARKTSALLKFAPVGSVVLRIAHKERQWKDNSVQVLVGCWQSEHVPSLHKTLRQVVASLLQSCRAELVPGLVSQLEASAPTQIDRQAHTFAVGAELVGSASRSGLAVEEFLQKEMQLTPVQVARSIARFPSARGLSIEANLKPKVEWFKGLGLSQSQVAKVIATFPPVLGCSIEANLTPTVEWIKGLGLSQSQIAKVIATFPPVLGCSIEANLKPTVEWVTGLGVSQSQVAKVIASHPQVLGYSIEANLKPKVEWFKGLGLSQSQIAKVIVSFPQVLGYSIEANLTPTVEWIKGLGLSQSQ
ncbi:MTERF5, partial [Symbiodinium sp. CCMP2456]